MDILTASQKLVNHFLKHDSINEEQIIELISEKEDIPSCNAAFVLALEELEKNGIISSKTEEVIIELEGNKKSKDKGTPEKIKFTTWVLKRPLQHREQVLILDGLTALKIAAIVNNFSQFTTKTMICNPIQITNNDIAVLLEVIALYVNQNAGGKSTSQPTEENKSKINE